MASSRKLKLPDGVANGDFPLGDLVIISEAPSMTLGAIVRALFDASAVKIGALINMVGRKVTAHAPEETVVADGYVRLGNLVRDDDTKSSSPMSFEANVAAAPIGAEETALIAAIELAIAPSKPSKSLATAIALVEDANAGLVNALPDGLIVRVNQDEAGAPIEIWARGDAALTHPGPVAVLAKIEQATADSDAPTYAWE